MLDGFDVFDNTPVISKFRDEYECFSNFSKHPLFIWGIAFDTSEHAYQWAKTNDPEEKQSILTKAIGVDASRNILYRPTTAGEAKRAGAAVTLREDWEDVRYDIMVEILRAKFQQNPKERAILLATQDAILIEGNTWHDNIWGRCSCANCESRKWTNLLGKALMQVRDELSNEPIQVHGCGAKYSR